MEIQINKICFSLPSRAFLIDYAVSQKRQLPVVKEFIVRLIFSLGGCSVNTIQQYFGFTDREMLSVIDDLHEERLIEWNEENIVLTHYASDKFVTIKGRMVPRFFEVVDKAETVNFDLHEFKILPNSIKRTSQNILGISMKLSDDSYRSLNEKARGAFDSDFQHYREVVKNEDIYSERQELYKINHVSSKYDSLIPIDVNYYIDSDFPIEIKTRYDSQVIDEWDEGKRLFTTMDESLEIGRSNVLSPKSFGKYLSISKDPFLQQYWNDQEDRLELNAFISNYSSGSIHHTPETLAIVGNFYTEFNAEAIIDKLKLLHNEKLNSSGVIWFGNSNSTTWGRTAGFENLITKITSLFDKRKSTSKAIIVMQCMSRSEAFVLDKIFGRVDASIIDCKESFGGDNSEILLIPNIMVACLYHEGLNDKRNLSIPVGYISFDQKIISSVTEKAVKWSSKKNQFNHYFEKKLTEDKNKVLNKHLIPILMQNRG